MAENIYNSELFKIRHWPLTILIIISLAVVIFLFYLPGLVDKTDKCTMGNAFYYTAGYSVIINTSNIKGICWIGR